jgi:hypothetical protein
MGARKFVTPEPGEDLAAIAARVLPADDSGGDSGDAAGQQLLSWNLHLAARAGSGLSIGLLPSDIVFTEPPPKRGAPS